MKPSARDRADLPEESPTMKKGLRVKRYGALLSGWVFSRPTAALVLLNLGFRISHFHGIDFVVSLATALATASVVAYFVHDSLPRRIWFEGETLHVEDVSGDVRPYDRWVEISQFNKPCLYAQNGHGTVRLPLFAYVAAPVEGRLA